MEHFGSAERKRAHAAFSPSRSIWPLTYLVRRIETVDTMAGRTLDPKPNRITLRLSVNDLRMVQREADRRRQSVGLVIRSLIRDHLGRRKGR